MTESYNINYIDESEYPSTTSIQNRSARDARRGYAGLCSTLAPPASRKGPRAAVLVTGFMHTPAPQASRTGPCVTRAGNRMLPRAPPCSANRALAPDS